MILDQNDRPLRGNPEKQNSAFIEHEWRSNIPGYQRQQQRRPGGGQDNRRYLKEADSCSVNQDCGIFILNICGSSSHVWRKHRQRDGIRVFERPLDTLDLFARQMRQIQQRALVHLSLAALAGFAQQNLFADFTVLFLLDSFYLYRGHIISHYKYKRNHHIKNRGHILNLPKPL